MVERIISAMSYGLSSAYFLQNDRTVAKNSRALEHTLYNEPCDWRKCAIASIKKGKVTRAMDVPFGSEVVNTLGDGRSHRYLGIAQVFHANSGEVRESLKVVYTERLRKIWKAQMSARNKIHAMSRQYFFWNPSQKDEVLSERTSCDNAADTAYTQRALPGGLG